MILITLLWALLCCRCCIGVDPEHQKWLDQLLSELSGTREKQEEKKESVEKDVKTAKNEMHDVEKEERELEEMLKEVAEKKRKAKEELEAAKKKKKEMMDEYLKTINRLAKNVIKNVPGEEDKEAEVAPHATEITLFEGADFNGANHTVPCSYYGKTFHPEGYTVRSMRLRNARAIVSSTMAPNRHEIGFNASVANFDDYFKGQESCCGAIKFFSLYPDPTPVYLYAEPEFEGESKFFLKEGDYDIEFKIQSVRVLAEYRLQLYGEVGQNMYLADFWHDNNILGATLPKNRDAATKIQHVKSIRITKEERVGATITYYENRKQLFPANPGAFTLPRWTEPNLITLDEYANVAIHTDTGDEWFAPKEPIKPPLNGKMIYVDGVCSSSYCGDHGRCIGKDECACHSGYSGSRCSIQFPDASSSIVCDSVAAFVDEPMQCHFISRKDNIQCNTHSMYIRVKTNVDSLHVFEGPITKEHGWQGPIDHEGDSFSFKVVSEELGDFSDWIDLSILHRPPGTYSSHFQPILQVRDRPTDWFVNKNEIIFLTEVPSSVNVLLQSKNRVPIPLVPIKQPLTFGFRLQEPFSGEGCLSITIVHEVHRLGCKRIDYVVESRVSEIPFKVPTRMAWAFLRFGRWEDAFRAATRTRDPEVMTVAQLAMGLVSAARINSRYAKTARGHFDFIKSCIQNKCPISALSNAYPTLPWHTSVPVVEWYEEKCAASILSQEYKKDKSACQLFTATCHSVIHLLMKQSLVTIITWADILKKAELDDWKNDLYEAKRLLTLSLSVASYEIQQTIVSMIQDVERRIAQMLGMNIKDKHEDGAEKEKQKKEKEKRSKKKQEEDDFDDDMYNRNYYELLGIPRRATAEQIRAAYHKHALYWHPDKNPSRKAHKMFLLIKKAYETLINPERRRKYDAGEDSSDAGPKQVVFREEIDRERMKRLIFWTDPETGESGSFEEDLPADEGAHAPPKEKQRPNARHCCLERPRKKKT